MCLCGKEGVSVCVWEGRLECVCACGKEGGSECVCVRKKEGVCVFLAMKGGVSVCVWEGREGNERDPRGRRGQLRLVFAAVLLVP